MKGLYFLILSFYSLFSFSQNHGQALDDLRQRQLDQLFNDQFFKQADQMFKQLRDRDGDPFDLIIQQFQRDFEQLNGPPSQWRETREGMVFVLPYFLSPSDKIDLKVSEGHIKLEIIRSSQTKSYEFPIPENTEPAQIEIQAQAKAKETWILFPWKKQKLRKLAPRPNDKVI